MSLSKLAAVPSGSLRITSTPAAAIVTIDGKAMAGKTPLTLSVALGHHTIQVALNGYETYRCVPESRW